MDGTAYVNRICFRDGCIDNVFSDTNDRQERNRMKIVASKRDGSQVNWLW